MAFEIKISEEYETSSYFWFRPARVAKKDQIFDDEDVEFADDFICIEEGDIECFLAYFLMKYFDSELFYNKHRYDYCFGYITEFEWHVDENFYTYETVRKMLDEMESAAKMLADDYDNEALAPIKEGFSIFYMTEREHSDHIQGNNAAIRDHIGVVIDFYDRFVKRMRKMMKDNPLNDIISISGP